MCRCRFLSTGSVLAAKAQRHSFLEAQHLRSKQKGEDRRASVRLGGAPSGYQLEVNAVDR